MRRHVKRTRPQTVPESVLGGGLGLAARRAALGRGGLVGRLDGLRRDGRRSGRAGQKARQGGRAVVSNDTGVATGSALGALRLGGTFGGSLGGVGGSLDRSGVALGTGFSGLTIEAGGAFLLAALPAFTAGLAAAAVRVEAALALGAGFARFARFAVLTRLVVAVAPFAARLFGLAVIGTIVLAVVVLPLASLGGGDAVGLGLFSGDDGRGLGAGFVLEIDVEALSRQFALGDLGHGTRGLERAQDAEIVFGVLGVVLGQDPVAAGRGVARQLHIALIDGLRVAADLDVLGALRVPGTVRIGGVGVVVAAAGLSVASALTLHALEISHRTLPCFV